MSEYVCTGSWWVCAVNFTVVVAGGIVLDREAARLEQEE
jgi:hypothetical protein